jgi:hypothetical protein
MGVLERDRVSLSSMTGVVERDRVPSDILERSWESSTSIIGVNGVVGVLAVNGVVLLVAAVSDNSY